MDRKQQLEFLDMSIQLDVQGALSSLALKWYMDQFFHKHDDVEKKRLFTTNIANNYLYQANLAHFEKNLLHAADEIHEALNRDPKLDIEVLHRWDLKNHRDYLSHPGKGGQFDNPEMKKFIDEDRHYKDPKAILLWNARRSILEALDKAGSDRSTKYPISVGLRGGMVELVQGAIHLCLKDDIPRPTWQEVFDILKSFMSDYQTAVSKEADRLYRAPENN